MTVAGRSTNRKRWAVDRQQLLILIVGAVMVSSFVLLVFWPQQRQLSALFWNAVERGQSVLARLYRGHPVRCATSAVGFTEKC